MVDRYRTSGAGITAVVVTSKADMGFERSGDGAHPDVATHRRARRFLAEAVEKVGAKRILETFVPASAA